LKVDIEQPRDWSRRLTITVPAERVQRERREVASQIAKRVKMPGFRKGKVPSSVVEKQYGASIDQQTIERVVNTAYQEALREEGMSPISQASVENVDYHPGSDLTFNVEFEVRPEIQLDRLGGFTIQAPASDVDDDDVDRVVHRLREQNATWTPVEEGTPAEGDRAEVEITPLHPGDDERPEPRRYEVVLGSGEILEDIDAFIRTLQPGEDGETAVALPEGADDDEGEHRIHLKLLSVSHPELPEADDAFAKEVGDFESLDALRTKIREDLQEEAERESDREVRRQLVHQVLEANPFDAPPSLVNQYLDSLMQTPPDADPQEMAGAREQARPVAEHGVRRMLMIDRVAEMEGLHATQDDVEQRVAEIAAANEMDAGQVRRQLSQSGRLQALASDIMEQRVFDYLKSLSTIEKEAE
jgi:trigger factor